MNKADWLDEVGADKTAMVEVKAVIDKWRELRFKLDNAEAVMAEAKKQYDEYVKTVSSTLRQNGLEALKLEDGSMLEVVEQVRCSITKDGRNAVADWLRNKGAEQLVKSQLVVDASHKQQLEEEGIAYDEEVSMNTNSVKAWVKGEMQMGTVGLNDLPKGLSWFQYDEVRVK